MNTTHPAFLKNKTGLEEARLGANETGGPDAPGTWAYEFHHKFDYSVCTNDSSWGSFWCDAGVFMKGCLLFVVQYGTLPAFIIGSGKLVEFLRSAES